jgi:hypothetical protein
LREDDTNGGIREKKGRLKSKIFINNYISLLKIAHQVAILSISTVPHQGLNNSNDSIK